uniref:tRNA pseudouridine synthase n=1 Tax=Rhizophora mucronata TaxID=61149 RepID=A0A2P2KZE6_RHIMU
MVLFSNCLCFTFMCASLCCAFCSSSKLFFLVVSSVGPSRTFVVCSGKHTECKVCDCCTSHGPCIWSIPWTCEIRSTMTQIISLPNLWLAQISLEGCRSHQKHCTA